MTPAMAPGNRRRNRHRRCYCCQRLPAIAFCFPILFFCNIFLGVGVFRICLFGPVAAIFYHRKGLHRVWAIFYLSYHCLGPYHNE
jgi:hypothetical protein